ncbi:MAG: amino acid ABC transporter permease [Oscillospiraceae bacterium]|nr:amino acid ABC transporter permease [Oscillospiraceae bacterium]
MDPSYILTLSKAISDGLGVTCGLFAITLAASLPLGLLISFMRVSRFSALRAISGFYVWLLRGTPLMLQLFFFYFGLPFLPFIGQYLILDRFPAACVAFILNYAAYFAEIFRGGTLSIDKGQYEAARVLGYSNFETKMKIVVPQMLRVCLPPVSNEAITLVKDTALVTAIGVMDMLYFAQKAVNRDVNPTAFLVVAVFYLVMTFIVTKVFRYLEKKCAF